MKHLFCILFLFSTVIQGNAARPPRQTKGSILLKFSNVVNEQALRLNDSSHLYYNANGDDFYITTFKYYISNIILTRMNGDTVHIPDSYFLINAADPGSLSQELTNVPAGKYKTIAFTIGVDSLRNFSGAQSGCLDPARGMFWTWKSGYIFVKMEGVSSKSTSKKNKLVYHIGGAIAPENTIRVFSQSLPSKLKIKEGKAAEIDITANAASLFSGNTTVKFSELSFTMGGPKSVIIADNYATGLFSVTGAKK